MAHVALSFEECPLNHTSHCHKRPTTFKGPMRLARLCILSIIFPSMLIGFPLYLRYKVYGDQLYPLAMSDMRLLDNKVSTTWCQRQLVKVNTTFNAFLLPESPVYSSEQQPLTMVRHLTLEDDMKEYWGFYLLKGSTVKVSTCVRWPGASLIVIRGHKHLHECAYIGDDSSEELDEMLRSIGEKGGKESESSSVGDGRSNSPNTMTRKNTNVELHNPQHQHIQAIETNAENTDVTDSKTMKLLLEQLKTIQMNNVKTQRAHTRRNQTVSVDEKPYITFDEEVTKISSNTKQKRLSASEELFHEVLAKLKRMGEKGQNVLERINVQMKDHLNISLNETDNHVLETKGRTYDKNRIKYDDNIEEMNRRKREIILGSAMSDRFNKDDEEDDMAVEEGFNPDGIADHRGFINETTLNDRSNSEFWSSFSSSEEALLNCAGLILNLPLTPHMQCERHKSDEDFEEASFANSLTYKVPSNGYYFFVFNSENEIQPNYIRVQFHLKKTMYNVSNPVAMCSNSTEPCALNLNFFSNEKLVMELPVKDNDTLWNQEFVVLSECEPRTTLYIICVISVPIFIVLFAFQ